MNGIEQSPILLALGYAIGHSIWQLSVLWFLYFTVNYIGNFSSNRRFIWSSFSAIGGMVWFIATLVYYLNNLKSLHLNNNLNLVSFETPGSGFAFYFQTLLATLNGLSPYLSCAYLLVVFVLCIRLINGFRQVKQLRSQHITKASAEWRLFVTHHSELLGIKKKVRIYFSKLATSPLTVGFLRPIILLPVASLNQLSIQQTEAILLHELAHIRRNDYLLNILLLFAEIILFFNPFMRLLLKQCRLERENSCDDFVLQFKYCPNDYARALLSMEKESMRSLLALGSNNNNQFQLLNRIKRLVAPERHTFNYKQQLGLLAIVTIVSVFFAALRPGKKPEILAKETIINKASEYFKEPAPDPILIGINLVSVLQNAPLNTVLKVEETWKVKQIQKEKEKEKIKTQEKEAKIESLTIASNQENMEEELIANNLEFEIQHQNQPAQSLAKYNTSSVRHTFTEQYLNDKIQAELNAAQLQIEDLTKKFKHNGQTSFARIAPKAFAYEFKRLDRPANFARIKKAEKESLVIITEKMNVHLRSPKSKAAAPSNQQRAHNKTIIINPPVIAEFSTNFDAFSETTIEINPEINAEALKVLEEKLTELEFGLMIILSNEAIIATQKAIEKSVNANIHYSNAELEKNAHQIKRIQEAALRYVQFIKIKKAKLKTQNEEENLDINIETEKLPRKPTYKTRSL